jgi:hypothetical protein
MDKWLTRVGLGFLASLTALTLALLSSKIERVGPDLVQYGNLCGPSFNEPCYKPVLRGGFPFEFLFDAPGVSIERQLHIAEDKMHRDALVMNIVVYFAIVVIVGAVIWRFRRGSDRADA